MLVGGIALTLVAAYFVVLYFKSKNRTLPYSRMTGLRTSATVRSEQVWVKVHKKYAWVFLGAATGFTVIGLWFILISFVVELQRYAMIVFYVTNVLTLMLVIGGGIGADRYARTIN